VDERGGEGEEEEQREEDADGGDDFGVNEALFGPCGLVLLGMEILACEAGDGRREGELANAEREGEDI